MKTLILPDLHTGYVRAEAIISKEKYDNIVFLGDYFDSFYDTLEETHQTAEWLKQSLTDPTRIHLLGNHDLAYMNQNFMCSGFSEGKLFAIKNTKVDLTKLVHYCWVNDWLCTHAGLSNEFFNAYNYEGKSVDRFLKDITLDKEGRQRLYDCSTFRGGRNAFGGIVWCDYMEFIDIPGIKQIFGHTKGDLRHKVNADMKNISKSSEHYCIDTGLKHYGVYDSKTKEMKIKESEV